MKYLYIFKKLYNENNSSDVLPCKSGVCPGICQRRKTHESVNPNI